MEVIWQGFKEAIGLIVRLEPEILNILATSLKVTGTAALIAMVIGMPIGTLVGLAQFRGRKLFITLVNTGMGLPPVVVGLFVFLLLSRYGPFGALEILYTPSAMVIAEVIIATPLVTGVTIAAIQALDPKLVLQILSLGANWWQLFWTLVREARLSMLAAIAAGFGAIISEIGAVLMVGGNIKGYTRVLTTAIVLETRQGNISMAIALSIILLTLTFFINWAFTTVQQRRGLR
ncbi:MAG: ABC transporter permease [Actinomycetota bacterium]